MIPTTSTIGGTTKGSTETNSIAGRRRGSRRWTQKIVGTTMTRLTATVSSAICTESQKLERNDGSSKTARNQWKPGACPFASCPWKLNCSSDQTGTRK